MGNTVRTKFIQSEVFVAFEKQLDTCLDKLQKAKFIIQDIQFSSFVIDNIPSFYALVVYKEA